MEAASTPASRRYGRDRVGFVIEASGAMDAIHRVREAEKEGVKQVWMTAGGAGTVDTLTLYAAAAIETKKIRLGTSIVPVYPRHPLVMAQQALGVYELAHGRFRLGVGPSHRHIMVQKYGLQMPTPLAYLKEYVSVLRNVLWEGEVNYHGRFFNVVSTFPRKAQIPLVVSALGLKAFRLAGEISDGAVSWMCPIHYLLDKAVPALRAGSEKGHRPAPPVVAHVPVALGADEAMTRAAARRRLQPYTGMPFYAHMFAEAGLPVAADGSGIDTLVDELFVTGDEANVRRQLRQFLARGLDELLITLVPVADEEIERRQLLHLIGSL